MTDQEIPEVVVDFNRMDDQGRVRLGPTDLERNAAALVRCAPGVRVLATDRQDTCEGVLAIDERSPRPFHVRIALDMATWTDGPGR